jgi:hypothetical protein
MVKTMVLLKNIVLQHPHLSMKTVVAVTLLTIALLANPAAAPGKILIVDD